MVNERVGHHDVTDAQMRGNAARNPREDECACSEALDCNRGSARGGHLADATHHQHNLGAVQHATMKRSARDHLLRRGLKVRDDRRNFVDHGADDRDGAVGHRSARGKAQTNSRHRSAIMMAALNDARLITVMLRKPCTRPSMQISSDGVPALRSAWA